ncbi:MAG: CapA family protein [Polyangiaceae bacterium]|nr:CapA family protein [Polyangiaceae bacterium]
MTSLSRRLPCGALVALSVALGCDRSAPSGPASSAATSSSPPALPSPPASSASPPPLPARAVLLLGGDVELARATGKRILADPSYDPLRRIRGRLDQADVSFVNLESQLSEQGGEVVRSWSSLVFTGPPGGADVLARAGIDVVSTANNHAWDYGERALRETLDNLDRVGVAHVGTSREAGDQARPVVVERAGVKIGFLAFTAIWNQGPLSTHPARRHVAEATRDAVEAGTRALVASGAADVVVVSVHGGEEYGASTTPSLRALLHAAARAGAHVVVGHHAHVFHGVSFVGDTPVFEGLGNLVMQMHREHPATELGLLARVTVGRGGASRVEACPHRVVLAEPEPVTGAALAMARRRLTMTSPAPLALEETPDGCFRLEPAR